MNKNVVLAVAKRDLRSWFGNPTGYVFIMLFVGLACAALVFSDRFFAANLANLDTLNDPWFPLLAILFVAAVTMNTWASERSNGTQELLFTLPARDSELLLGKYLAGLGVYTLALAFMLTLPIGLGFLGSPDWGQIFANFVGYWLFGAMLVAVTMLGSQLHENVTIALILGALTAAAVVYSGRGFEALGFGTSWRIHGPEGQLADFGRGWVTAGGVLLYVGLAVAFFYLNLALLARRHYRADEPLHYGVRFGAISVAAIALTVIGVHSLGRADLTVERVHSLGDESTKLLASLSPERPVVVTAYVSEDMHPVLVQQKRNLLNLLDQFDRIGGDAVEQRVVVLEPFSPEATKAQKNYNIQPRTLPFEVRGAVSQQQVYLGFVVQSGTENVVVPFVEPATPLEYELTRSIRVAAKADRKKVGVLKTDVELYGGFDFQTFEQKPRWQIVEELMLQYTIENVDADKDYPEGIEALVVPQPSSLTQEQMDRLQGWILAGNAALLLEDPAPISAPGTAATDPKGGKPNMFGGPPPGGQKGDIAAFLAAVGASMQTDQVVWDLSYRALSGYGVEDPEVLVVGQDGIAQQDPITKGLDRVVVLLGGAVRSAGKAGFSFEPLLHSPKPTELTTPAGDLVQVLGWTVDKPKDAPDGDSVPTDFPAKLKVAFQKGQGFDAESFLRGLVGQSLRVAGRFTGAEEDLDRLAVPARIDGYTITKAEGAQVQAALQIGVRMQEDAQGGGSLVLGGPNGLIPKLSMFVFNPFGGPQQIDPRRRHTPRPNDYVLAARITGQPVAAGASTGEGGEAAKPAGKAPRVILLGDLDMVGNVFFGLRRQSTDANMRFDNVAFVLNCIDSLVGDDSLIELRKRRPTLRTLTAVEDAQRQFETTWLDEKERAEAAAKKALDVAQKRLDKAVEKVRNNDAIDEQAKEIQIQSLQNAENRKLELERARIDELKNQRIQAARHTRDQQKLRLYNWYAIGMLVLSVLPALAMGILTFVRRQARANAIVPDRRKVQ